MAVLKIILIIFGVIILSIISLLVLAKTVFSQKVINDFEVNTPSLKSKVLIASQGSNFKTQLVDKLVNSLKNQSVYIKLTDVTRLSTVDIDGWNAIVIINTCEGGIMQKDVSNFLDNNKDTNKIILLTTSGSGIWQPKDIKIDSISSASRKQDINKINEYLYNKINLILKKTNS